jgi:hypothetical protein
MDVHVLHKTVYQWRISVSDVQQYATIKYYGKKLKSEVIMLHAHQHRGNKAHHNRTIQLITRTPAHGKQSTS